MHTTFDAAHQRELARWRNSFTGRSDWPTWLLLVATYTAWFTLVLASPWLGAGVAMLLLVPVVTLWMSLQHELLHGHPTRWLWLNKALGYAPFALWYPYKLYRDSHLQHHQEDTLTRPGLDPESRYLSQQHWQASGRPVRLAHWLGKTLPGRVLLGPWLAVWGLAREQGTALWRGDAAAWRLWGCHGAACLVLLKFIQLHASFGPLAYVLGVSLPALGLAMVRSYYEHRPATEAAQRSVINEAGWPWRWLFLNLNLHLVHHEHPWLPWYLLPRAYAARREQWLALNGGFHVAGYAALWRQHWRAPIDSPQHPWD